MVYVFVFMLVTMYFCYYSSVLCHVVNYYNTFTFIIFVQDHYGYFMPFELTYELYMCCIFCICWCFF